MTATPPHDHPPYEPELTLRAMKEQFNLIASNDNSSPALTARLLRSKIWAIAQFAIAATSVESVSVDRRRLILQDTKRFFAEPFQAPMVIEKAFAAAATANREGTVAPIFHDTVKISLVSALRFIDRQSQRLG